MALKVHVICAKFGSDKVDIVLADATVDDPRNIALFSCSNCKELTGLDEWADANKRQVVDRRVKMLPTSEDF